MLPGKMNLDDIFKKKKKKYILDLYMNFQCMLNLVVGVFGGGCKIKWDNYPRETVDYSFFCLSFTETLSKVIYFRIISVIVSSEHISSVYVESILACVIWIHWLNAMLVCCSSDFQYLVSIRLWSLLRVSVSRYINGDHQTFSSELTHCWQFNGRKGECSISLIFTEVH